MAEQGVKYWIFEGFLRVGVGSEGFDAARFRDSEGSFEGYNRAGG